MKGMNLEGRPIQSRPEELVASRDRHPDPQLENAVDA